MPARELLLHRACVGSGLGVALAGGEQQRPGQAAHVIAGGIHFAMGAVGVGWQTWEAVKRLRNGGRQK
jgi:hypothetical protein